MVALDIDGTLIPYADFHAPPSRLVSSAVARVAAGGAHPVISTGRSLHSTYPVFDALDLTDGFAVCSNGAYGLSGATRSRPSTASRYSPAFTLSPGSVKGERSMGFQFRPS